MLNDILVRAYVVSVMALPCGLLGAVACNVLAMSLGWGFVVGFVVGAVATIEYLRKSKREG